MKQKTTNHNYKNIETYVCKYCGSLFKRRTKKGKRNNRRIRGKRTVTCSSDCSKLYARLLCNSEVRERKEKEHKKKMEKLRKMGVI